MSSETKLTMLEMKLSLIITCLIFFQSLVSSPSRRQIDSSASLTAAGGLAMARTSTRCCFFIELTAGEVREGGMGEEQEGRGGWRKGRKVLKPCRTDGEWGGVQEPTAVVSEKVDFARFSHINFLEIIRPNQKSVNKTKFSPCRTCVNKC